MNFAVSAAITKSQDRTRLQPAPAAAPLTAHTTGFSSAQMAFTIREKPNVEIRMPRGV
jgi:hypothetical protein